MKAFHRITLLGMAAWVVLLSFGSRISSHEDNNEGEAPFQAVSKLKPGMSPQAVRLLLGSPQRIARQFFYHHGREQWIYDSPLSVRLTFDCPRGQKPQLLPPRTDLDTGSKTNTKQ